MQNVMDAALHRGIHPLFVFPKALASEELIYSEGTHYQTAHNTGAIYSALAVILQIVVVC